MIYDKIIIGAGIYGLYAAVKCGTRGEHILVLECEREAFSRATYVNQARVHMGYHYPRSISTALKSANYFERFCVEYSDCILKEFDQIYATSSDFSYTNANQFKKFCDAANIDCYEVNPKKYFKEFQCDGAFLTKEYTYDAKILRDIFLEQISRMTNVKIVYGSQISSIKKYNGYYHITYNNVNVKSKFVLNATYASTNQILKMVGYDLFDIKYELCEIILCNTNNLLSNIGLTVMDGPFFSIMPFGLTGRHSLTAVSFTPHETSKDFLPYFKCMDKVNKLYCSSEQLGNCNKCACKPESAYEFMAGLAHKYMRDEYEFSYCQSLFSMKPILKSTEVDDSRPTVIKINSENPTFISVLSGKINTIFDLDEVLENEQ